ncbi:concanavalin A-like lectin/glucanase [Exidia glandulosa HHB12029]|uniref:Concanavalin A-like lectin/glucanase n=1 Tax=Exidia glandulosa HHB12029 TaxID=1314781 RepID=A0A166BG53_EXIGL|nr:concanavalin A-like lectin/glucanase [Exidia glandulosa HHB12029]
MFLSLAFVTLAASLASAVPCKRQDSCACGYVDDTGAVWREAVESDFTSSSGALSVVQQSWDVQTWTSGSSDVALARQNVAENVFEYQDALGLKTSAYDGSGTTKVAEIDSKRSDILFGTFRMRAQVPSTPGVCFGFFSYNGNTTPVSETDIEFLTAMPDYYQRVHYTNQPGNVNGETDFDAYHNVVVDGADFTTFGEHRFDWHPGSSTFYYNGALTSTITKNVPAIGSAILANVWSNGDPGWSAGPPTADAIATVQYIKMYFNSTSVSEDQFVSQCQAAGNVAQCKI